MSEINEQLPRIIEYIRTSDDYELTFNFTVERNNPNIKNEDYTHYNDLIIDMRSDDDLEWDNKKQKYRSVYIYCNNCDYDYNDLESWFTHIIENHLPLQPKKQYTIDELNGYDRLETFKLHLKHHQHIDVKDHFIIDIQSINLFLNVYEGLTSHKAMENMLNVSLVIIIKKLWSLVK